MLNKNEEKKIWMPTMITVAATTAMCSSASEPNPWEIQVPTMTPPRINPIRTNSPPEHQTRARA